MGETKSRSIRGVRDLQISYFVTPSGKLGPQDLDYMKRSNKSDGRVCWVLYALINRAVVLVPHKGVMYQFGTRSP